MGEKVKEVRSVYLHEPNTDGVFPKDREKRDNCVIMSVPDTFGL